MAPAPSKIVKLKISSSVLSQFPDLPTEIQPKKTKASIKLAAQQAAAQQTHISAVAAEVQKASHAPAESSPLAQPKPIRPVDVQIKTEQDEGNFADVPNTADTPIDSVKPTTKNTVANSISRPDTPLNANAAGVRSAGIATGPTRSGLVMNATTSVELDKSGKPAKKWTRTTRTLRSFSGFNIPLGSWKCVNPDTALSQVEVKVEESVGENGKDQASDKSSDKENENKIDVSSIPSTKEGSSGVPATAGASVTA